MSQDNFLTINELDYVRLTSLVYPGGREPTPDTPSAWLADVLEQADQYMPDEMPHDVITMHSKVEVRDESGQRIITLCYPKDADAQQGMVSVLSPLGANLLGTRVPGEVSWTGPDGATRRIEVLTLCYQPESAGDYTV